MSSLFAIEIRSKDKTEAVYFVDAFDKHQAERLIQNSIGDGSIIADVRSAEKADITLFKESFISPIVIH